MGWYQPSSFHQKWVSLTVQKDPNGDNIAAHLGLPCSKLRENPNGGQNFNFLGGDLVTLDNNSPPIVCYGAFNAQVFYAASSPVLCS
jgi:hypothetical protein